MTVFNGIKANDDGSTSLIMSGTESTRLYPNEILAKKSDLISSRQTVRYGSMDINGLPNYLSIGTGLSVNVAATNVPLVITAAGGDISGDVVSKINVDFNIANLTALATNYLYADFDLNGNIIFGSTTIAPVYQWAGNPSITNGAFTFNISSMLGYIGNGVAATNVRRVFIGEANCNATNVISVLNYPINKSLNTRPCFSAYQSVSQNLPTNTATKILFQTKEFDLMNDYDTNTSRFKPKIPGVYLVTSIFSIGTSSCNINSWIYKNGTQFKQLSNMNVDGITSGGTVEIYLNGVTDYLEVFGYISIAQNLNGNPPANYFQACLIA